jgi:hypothetical protein
MVLLAAVQTSLSISAWLKTGDSNTNHLSPVGTTRSTASPCRVLTTACSSITLAFFGSAGDLLWCSFRRGLLTFFGLHARSRCSEIPRTAMAHRLAFLLVVSVGAEALCLKYLLQVIHCLYLPIGNRLHSRFSLLLCFREQAISYSGIQVLDNHGTIIYCSCAGVVSVCRSCVCVKLII